MASPMNPSEGYTTFSSAQSDLFQMKQKYDEVILAADAAKGFVANAWTGEGSTALQANVQTYRNSIPDLKAVLESARQALITYRTSLNAIASAQGHWLTEYNNMNYQLNQADRNILTDPVGAADDAADRVNNWIRFEAAEYQLRQLYTRRREVDATVIAALGTAMPASWADTSAGFAAAGITQAMQLTSSTARQAMLDVANRLAQSDLNSEDAEDIAALAAFYDMYGNDHSFMAQFYRALGGQATVELVEAIGEKMPNNIELDVASALARQIREGLSVASAGWTPSNGAAFAESMFEADRSSWSSIGYLFNDPLNAPIGETTALAAAGIVDEIERAGGSVLQYGSMSGGSNLSFLDYPEDNDENLRVADPSGPIFSTLGTYPESAFDFLTDPEFGDKRIEYWYGDRQTFESDKNQGIADLWLGTQLAEGGPYDPDDKSRMEESAALSAKIIEALVGNEYFLPENVSDSAGAAFAGSFLVNIETFTELMRSEEKFPTDDDYIPIDLKFGTPPVTTYGPNVSDDVLACFLAVITGNDTGAAVLTSGIADYQMALVAMGGMSDDPGAYNDALERIMVLQGVVDGATLGGDLQTAEAIDVRTQAAMDYVSDILGAIPIGSIAGTVLDGSVFALDMLQNYGQGMAADGAAGWLVNTFGFSTDHLATVYDTYFDETEQRQDITSRYQAAQALFVMMGGGEAITLPDGGGVIPPLPEVGSANYEGELNDWYMENYEKLEVASGSTADIGDAVGLYELGKKATVFDVTSSDEREAAVANN